MAANQKVKFAMAKAVSAFQLTDEYNTILFCWYYKGFRVAEKIIGEAWSRDGLGGYGLQGH